MKKKSLVCIFMISFALLFGGCSNSKMPEANITSTVGPPNGSAESEVASVSDKFANVKHAVEPVVICVHVN